MANGISPELASATDSCTSASLLGGDAIDEAAAGASGEDEGSASTMPDSDEATAVPSDLVVAGATDGTAACSSRCRWLPTSVTTSRSRCAAGAVLLIRARGFLGRRRGFGCVKATFSSVSSCSAGGRRLRSTMWCVVGAIGFATLLERRASVGRRGRLAGDARLTAVLRPARPPRFVVVLRLAMSFSTGYESYESDNQSPICIDCRIRASWTRSCRVPGYSCRAALTSTCRCVALVVSHVAAIAVQSRRDCQRAILAQRRLSASWDALGSRRSRAATRT